MYSGMAVEPPIIPQYTPKIASRPVDWTSATSLSLVCSQDSAAAEA